MNMATTSINGNSIGIPNDVTSERQHQQQQHTKPTQQIQLCASCDRCRARKTKCDGSRPCANCVTRYRKAKKCESIEGVDLAAFDCIYSPAKRRGPIPGRSAQSRISAAATAAFPNSNKRAGSDIVPIAGQTYAAAAAAGLANNTGSLSNHGIYSLGLNMEGMSPLAAAAVSTPVGGGQKNVMMLNNTTMNTTGTNDINNNSGNTFSADELKQMLAMQQQLLVQQQQMQQQQQQQGILQQLAAAASVTTGTGNINGGSLTAVNNTVAVGSPAAVGMINMMGGAPTNVWNDSINMGGTNNGIPGGFTMNINDGSLNNTMDTTEVTLINNNTVNFEAQPQQQPQTDDVNQSAKRVHRVENFSSSQINNTVDTHMPLLQLNNPNGAILRSYYELSTNDVLNLPPIPTDEEYCARLNVSYNLLPMYDKSALQAARFAELALGALANNQVPLALELSNSSVMCLRNCVSTEETSGMVSLFNVARAYLLHGIFRSFRGDMARYFKYRRVCMTHIMQMNNESGVESLLAAISFHDAWAYLMHNAAEDSLPDIDDSLPRLSTSTNGGSTYSSMIATDPINQMWMQGSPRVFLNNEATPISRSLDALACAIRTCCDQANCQFEDNAKAAESEVPGILSLSHGNGNGGEQFPGVSPTTSAVLANENELCSRNMVLSAKSLLDQDSGMSNGTIKKHGLYMVSSVMSAFLENGEMEEPLEGTGGGGGGGGNSNIGGFTDGQIRNLLVGCETIIQHPLLLHCPGPIYHMASNAAILLCHLLNGIHAKCGAAGKGGISPSCSNNKVEGILFDEVLDTFMATRKALNIHRKSLPVKLRCHGIPRPSGVGPFKKVNNNPEAPFIDLGDTLMCLCRGCQNFVLMGCSPCVAAERSMKAAAAHATRDRQQSEEKSGYDEFDRELGEVDDLSLDDDALLDVLSRIVQN